MKQVESIYIDCLWSGAYNLNMSANYNVPTKVPLFYVLESRTGKMNARGY